MAMALGKLSILIGAGIVGSVFAKDSQMPSVSDVLKGAYKIAFNPFSGGDSGSPAGKPKNEALILQVNNLRQELQMLQSNRPITIVTTSAGGKRSGVIVLVVVAGTVYLWWKGWLPDLKFATKRSLSDACNSIANQLEEVYSSIRATRRDLSSQVDNTSSSVNELLEQQKATKDEVSNLRGEVDAFGVDIQTCSQSARTFDSKVHGMQETADIIFSQVMRLVGVVSNMEKQKSIDSIQGSSNSSRPALEPPPLAPSSRSISLPPALPMEERSPTAASSASDESQPQQHLRSRSPTIGLKDVGEISTLPAVVSRSPRVPNETQFSSESNGSIFSRITSGGSFLSRTRSAIQGFK